MTDERLAVARRVMQAMRHADTRELLKVRNDEGALPVVICVASDTMAYATSRVRDAGGHANVIVPSETSLHCFGWTLTPDEELFAGDGPIHPDSTLAMLVAYFKAAKKETCHFQISSEYGLVDVS